MNFGVTLLAKLIQTLRSKRSLLVLDNCEHLLQACAELADSLLRLLQTDLSGPLHLAGADAVSRHEFAELIAREPRRGAPAPPGRPKNCALASIRVRPLRGVRAILGEV